MISKFAVYGGVLCRTNPIGIICPLRNYANEASIKLEDSSFKLFQLESGPPTSITLTTEQAKKDFYDMLVIRRMENSASNLYKEKIIRGFLHLYAGEEAVAVGFKPVLRKEDRVITAYRCHGWGYLMDITAHGILAELGGRQGACQRGKGGSMHVYSPDFYGGNGIVGSQVPMGTGIALACKYNDTKGVCITAYGDGAANQGQVHEAYNIACLLKLPVVYLCENNRYGMGTAVKRHSCNPDLYTRGALIPGIWVDGMNVMAVRSAAAFAIDFAQKNGPILIEAFTYRYFGHSMSDPGLAYRPREEVTDVREKQDPINFYKNLCLSNGVLTEDDVKKITEEARKEVDTAIEKVRAAPEVDLKELYSDVYINCLEPIRGADNIRHEHVRIYKIPSK